LVEGRPDGDVLAADSREMDEDFAIFGAAEDEPGIALVGESAIGLQLEAGLDERAFYSIELREFARRPVVVGPQTLEEWDNLGRHGAKCATPCLAAAPRPIVRSR
jgi:hypothetical protein